MGEKVLMLIDELSRCNFGAFEVKLGVGAAQVVLEGYFCEFNIERINM